MKHLKHDVVGDHSLPRGNCGSQKARVSGTSRAAERTPRRRRRPPLPAVVSSGGCGARHGRDSTRWMGARRCAGWGRVPRTVPTLEKAAGLEKARGGWGRLEKASGAVDAPAGVWGSCWRGASLAARPWHLGRQPSRSKSEEESYVAALGARGRSIALDDWMRSGNFFCS
jgi:hypothetical protein